MDYNKYLIEAEKLKETSIGEIFYSKKVIGASIINDYNIDLTVGKIYNVIDRIKITNPRCFNTAYYFYIINDNNIEIRYDIKFFISMNEHREKQLEKLLNESR